MPKFWKLCKGLRRRTSRSDLRGARYGEKTMPSKYIAGADAVPGSFVHVTCSGLRESDLAEKLFGRSERDWARQPDAAVYVGGSPRRDSVPGRCFAVAPLGPSPVAGGPTAGANSRGTGLCGHGSSVRVIASSTVDLATAVAERVFLSSLYYYLKVVEIHVPPLRYRSQDLCVLAQDYLAIANATQAHKAAKPRVTLPKRPCSTR